MASLKTRFDPASEVIAGKTVAFMSCFFDAGFKSLAFLNEQQRKMVEDEAANLIEEMDTISQSHEIECIDKEYDELQNLSSDSDAEVVPHKKKAGLSKLLGSFYQEKALTPEVNMSQF